MNNANFKLWLRGHDLEGKSGKKYNFFKYFFDVALIKQAQGQKGLYYIGKIDDFPEVVDRYELNIIDDISAIKEQFENHPKIKQDSEHYLYFIYEGNDKLSLEEIYEDLNIDEYTKKI